MTMPTNLNQGEAIALFHHGEARVNARTCRKRLCRTLLHLGMLVLGAFLLVGICSFVVGAAYGEAGTSSPAKDSLLVNSSQDSLTAEVDDIVAQNSDTLQPRQSPTPTSLPSKKKNIAEANPIPDAARSSTSPTERPSMSPTRWPRRSPTQLPSLTPLTCGGEVFGCRTDRIGHGQPLLRGEAVCSRKDQYVFGLNDDGMLLWRDCTTDKTEEYYKGGDGNVFSFTMEKDANFVINDEDGNVVWEKQCKETVPFTSTCKRDPTFDCPYLHLHKGGVMVVNFIDPIKGWVSRNFKKLYDF